MQFLRVLACLENSLNTIYHSFQRGEGSEYYEVNLMTGYSMNLYSLSLMNPTRYI